MKAEMPLCYLLDLSVIAIDDVDIRLAAVGDKDLAAVQHIVVAVQHRLGLLAGGVGACAGLCQAESAQLLAAWPASSGISPSAPAVPNLLIGSVPREVCADTITPVVPQTLDSSSTHIGVGQGITALAAALLSANGMPRKPYFCSLSTVSVRKRSGLVDLLRQGALLLFRRTPGTECAPFHVLCSMQSTISSYIRIYSPRTVRISLLACNRRSRCRSCVPACRRAPFCEAADADGIWVAGLALQHFHDGQHRCPGRSGRPEPGGPSDGWRPASWRYRCPLTRGDAFCVDADCLVDHRDKDAVDNKAGSLFDLYRGLADLGRVFP